MNQTPPAPDRRSAIIISAGIVRPQPTLHHYVQTRECELPGEYGGIAYEFLFRCSVTGAVRRYGAVERQPTPSWLVEGN